MALTKPLKLPLQFVVAEFRIKFLSILKQGNNFI